MSKPIINGIDVSECEFYFEDNGVIAPDGTPERANICTSPERSCENNDSCYCNKDCYFKQFKRLQEENKELKSRNANLRLNLATYDLPEVKKVLTDWRTGELDKKFKKLQKENEKLKTENEKLKQPCLVMPKVKQLAVPVEKYEKLYKALEEIRDIAKYSIMHNSELNSNYQIILQNINEVLNDRD